MRCEGEHELPVPRWRCPIRPGSAHDIRKVALADKVHYTKVAAKHGEPYAIDHTGFIYLVDRDGKYLGFFPPGTPPDRMVEIIRQDYRAALATAVRSGADFGLCTVLRIRMSGGNRFLPP